LGHETIKEQLNANMYFAYPYCSREHGLNENTNGLIRQYPTKGSSFENITDEEIETVMNKLNYRARKHLMPYFLLTYCNKHYQFQDCTSELNPPISIAY
jgi:IS30 family transposase